MKRLSLIFGLLVASLPTRAQTQTYSGTVVDAATQARLPGVQIAFKTSPTVTAGTTDAQGAFSITPSGIRTSPPRSGRPLEPGFTFNPAYSLLSWDPRSGISAITLRDVRGSVVLHSLPGHSGQTAQGNLALAGLGEGLYFLEAEASGAVHRFRLISLGALRPQRLLGEEAPLPFLGKRAEAPATLVFKKEGYAVKELLVPEPRSGISVALTASVPEAPKSLVFGSPHGSTMEIRGMSGKETVDVTKETLSFSGAGSGGIMFFPVEGLWDQIKDYSEFKGMTMALKTPVKVVVTVYTGRKSADDGSCTAIPDCGAKRFEVSAGTDGSVSFDFASGTTLGTFDMTKFRMVALWTGSLTPTVLTRLEFTGTPKTAECGAPGYTLARNEPPHCKSYVVIGQHADANEYLADNALPDPAGIMTYWEEFGAGTGGSFPAVKAEESGMLVNVGVSLKQGAGCNSDGAALRNWMGSYWDNTPVFLRVGYEIDNEHAHCLGSIKSIFGRYRATFAAKPNVALVWHTSGFFPDNGTRREITAEYLESVWPGDANVDWIGISYFTNSWQWKAGMMNTIIAFARKHGKPIMLAEASVTDNSGVVAATIWDNFFEQGIRSLVANPDNRIKMVAYIATHWRNNGWSAPFDTDTRFTGSGPIAQHKGKWVDMIETADAGNVFLNKQDIAISAGRIMVK